MRIKDIISTSIQGKSKTKHHEPKSFQPLEFKPYRGFIIYKITNNVSPGLDSSFLNENDRFEKLIPKK